MASIDWAVVSDLAFFDRHGRLCLVGITSRLIVPALPVTVRQLMVAARIVDPSSGDDIDVGLSVMTPGGTWAVPDYPDGMLIEMATEYVLVTLRDLPLTEEGTYRFELHLDEQTVTVGVAVCVQTSSRYAEVH